MNNIKIKKINNLYIKLIKQCHQLLKKFYRISDGLSGMKRFMMKINGISIGKILGKIFIIYFIFKMIDHLLGNSKDQKLIKNFCIFQKPEHSAQKTVWLD